MALTNHSRSGGEEQEGEGEGARAVSPRTSRRDGRGRPFPAAREIRETQECRFPGESVPNGGCDGGGETKRKIMIAGTPKHNDNIQCWAKRKERRKSATEMDGRLDGWMAG